MATKYLYLLEKENFRLSYTKMEIDATFFLMEPFTMRTTLVQESYCGELHMSKGEGDIPKQPLWKGL